MCIAFLVAFAVSDAVVDCHIARTLVAGAKKTVSPCGAFPGEMHARCLSVLQKTVPVINQGVKSGLKKKEIVKSLGMCADIKLKNSVLCDVCQDMVIAVEKMIDEGKVEEEIIKEADRLCQLLPVPYASLCAAYVNQGIEQLIQQIQEGLETMDICVMAGLCPEEGKKQKKARCPGKVKMSYDDMACDMCTKIVLYVEEILKDTREEQEIVKFVQQYCKKLPAPLSTLCGQLAADYVPLIMIWLEQGLEVLDICVKVGFCPQTAKKAVERAGKKFVSVRYPVIKGKKFDNDMACDMCTKIVLYVEEILKDTREEQEIVKFVQQYCEKLPVPLSTLCDQLASDYVPLIMIWLEQGLEVLDICVKVGFCPQNAKPKQAKKVDGVTCDACVQFVDFAKEKLETIAVAELWKLVSVECPKVEVIKHICELITEDNIHQWVDVIAAKIDSRQACQLVQLC